MRVVVNGKPAGTKETGCALCGATWGEYYTTVEGDRLFFCCDLCAKGFINIINEVKRRTGWSRVDEIEIRGNYYTGRTCTARHNGREYRFYVQFNDEAEIVNFKELT